MFYEILEKLGQMPLPPYIHETPEDPDRYQTVYAKYLGSAAAPTAGLHFTEDLFKRIREKGVAVAEVTLHVGLGTFRPVKVENIEEHHMHSERYRIDEAAAETIRRAQAVGGRVIAALYDISHRNGSSSNTMSLAKRKVRRNAARCAMPPLKEDG